MRRNALPGNCGLNKPVHEPNSLKKEGLSPPSLETKRALLARRKQVVDDVKREVPFQYTPIRSSAAKARRGEASALTRRLESRRRLEARCEENVSMSTKCKI